MNSNGRTLLSFLAAIALGSVLFGQTQTGTITGTVSDETGAVLPGVTVTLSSEALIAGTRVAVTDETGIYNFTGLPPGTYDLTFELSGFAPTRQESIKVSPYFVGKVNVVMKVGAVEEVITVTGESPAVDVKSNVITTDVDRDLLDHIPSGRDIWVIAEQVPGVVQDRYNIGGTESAQQSSGYIHGAQAQQEFAFDGLINNWPGGHGGYVMVYFDYDSFEEVQVVTSGAPAEVGTSGMYMNMVTKSGGNDFHGTTTFLYQPGSWQSNNVSDELRREYGIERANPVDHILNFAPTLGGPIIRNKMWFFGSYLRYDVNTEVPGYTLPDGSPEVDVNHQTNVMGKVTTELNPNNKLMGMYYFNYQNRFYRRAGYNFVSQDASWRQIEPAHIVQGQWTSILPRDLLLDLRLGYVTHVFPLEPQPGLDPSVISRVDDVQSTLVGAADYYHWHTAPRTQINASLSGFATSALGGSHDWKVGIGHSRQYTLYDQWVQGDRAMHFNDGVPAYVMVYAPVEDQKSNFNTWSAFAQDSWTIADRLTLNLGVRFEHFRGFNEAQGSPAGIFFPARQYPAQDNIPEWNDIVPRLGASFDVMGDGRTAIKASYSKYTQLEGARLPQTLNPNTQYWEYRPWEDRNGNNFAELDELLPAIARGGGINVSLDPDTTRPLTWEATAGIDQQLGEDFSVAATYHHRRNYNWMGQINRAVPEASYTPVNVTTPAGKTITVYNQDPSTLGEVDRVITNIPEFYENYDGVEITLRKRMSNRWQMLAGYTRGRSKGYYAEARWSFVDVNDPNNLVNIRDAYHPQDRPNIVKLQGTYVLPKNVQLSANYRYYTGEPITRWLWVNLNQGWVSVAHEQRGTFRYPNVSILDLRASKIFDFGSWNLEGMLQLFNALNADTVVNQVTTIGSSYGRPSKLLTPRIVGFGVRLTF